MVELSPNLWGQILEVFEERTGTILSNAPQVTLLTRAPEVNNKPDRKLLSYMLGAARMTIPRYWKTDGVPSILEWHNELEGIRRAESTMVREENKRDKYNKIWEGWETCKKTANYQETLKRETDRVECSIPLLSDGFFRFFAFFCFFSLVGEGGYRG